MSNTGLEIFDKTVHETHCWLKVVMEELETDDRHVAFTALRAGLHALRDRIGAINAVHLAAQLPMLLRGAFYEGWRPGSIVNRERHVEEFINHVDSNLPRNCEVTPAATARATFAVLSERLDGGEMKKVIKILPQDFAILLPAGRNGIPH